MTATETQESADLIAIVGMAGRFPGAPDTESLWNLLSDGRDAIRPVPADRWDATAQLDPEKEIQAVGGFLEGVDLFDAGFFGISPREAAAIDPQQRLLLESAWRALEDAGQPASSLAGTRTGVYVGASWHDYELLRMDRGAHATPHSLVGNALDVLAARLSYFFGLRGPSMTVETGCSSSLVALHLAAQALGQGDIDSALVGGTNLMLNPHVTVGLTHFGGLSPDGRCATFSDAANGFVRGEGVAALYVKTLKRALADGDRIHGVVVRTVVNNDGGGDSLVTPSPVGQEDLLRRAYGEGIVPKGGPVYVEAHGTGTGRGDPIEATALGSVLGRERTEAPLLVGSVKTNIGHLEASAGMAGLFKLLLSLRHRTVPPSLNSPVLNPEIPFEELGLRVVRESTPLDDEGPLYMGVSSFGWGGTNAHVVVASPPEPGPAGGPLHVPAETLPTGLPTVVPLSAKRGPDLTQRIADLDEALGEGDEPGLAGLAGTLAHRRDHFPVRAAFVASSAGELRARLQEAAADGGTDADAELPGVVTGRAVPRGRTAFVFPGQGSQWSGMGRDLYRSSPRFRATVDRCAQALRRHVSWDPIAVFTGADDDTWMARIDMLQPTLWAMSLGLAELWRAAGTEPDVVLGHSQGEITAATFAGILSYDDAALVMARRSAIARRASGHGRMLAVDLDREAAEAALEGFEETVSLAVHNGPRSCVLSGDEDDVLVLKELLDADGVFCRLVNVDYASHSPQMDPLREELLSELAPARPRAGDIPLMSTVRVGMLDGTEMDAAYWAENLRRPVRFAETMASLLDDDVTHVVEISPHPVLAPAIEQLGAGRAEPPAVLTTLRREHGAAEDAALALARGYVAGLEPFGEAPWQHPVPVPGYPLRPDSFWTPERHRRTTAVGFSPPLTPVPGEAGAWAGALELSLTDLPWLADHAVYETPVLPGAAMLTLAVNTARTCTGRFPGSVTHVDFHKEIALSDDGIRMTTEWREHGHTRRDSGSGDFRLLSLAEGADVWDVNATMRFCSDDGTPHPTFPAWADDTEPSGAEEFYRQCDGRGLGYGPAFRGVRSLRAHSDGESVLGEVVLAERLRVGNREPLLHPALWDGAMQVSLALLPGNEAVVPTSLRRTRILGVPESPVTAVWSHAVRRGDDTVDVMVYDTERRPLVAMEGLELRVLPKAEEAGTDGHRLHHLIWSEAPQRSGPEGQAVPEGASPGRWVVCGMDPEQVDSLAAALETAGATAARFVPKEAPGPRVTADDLGRSGPPAAVVFLATQHEGDDEPPGGGLTLLTETVRACTALGTPPSLAVVTDAAQPVVADDVPEPSVAGYWGFTRALRREHAELNPRLIDVRTAENGWAAACAAELRTDGQEDQTALRDGRLYTARLVRGAAPESTFAALPEPTTGFQPFRASAGDTGRRRSLRCTPLPRRRPGPGEIEIEVLATALSPHDPADALGSECVGRVAEVGPGVTAPALGERVAAAVAGALASHVTVRADHTQRVPEWMDDATAAALPFTATAAWYALTDLGRLESESTVVVHGAGDGIGHAAAGVARALGAHVIATAPGQSQREHLRKLGLGEVLDSRDAGWTDEVWRATGGRGADLVVNMLGGAAVRAGLETLADDGRLVTLGPPSVHTGHRVGLESLGRSVTLSALDPARLMRTKPERFACAQASVWEFLRETEPQTAPVHAVGFDELAEAARLLRSTGSLGTVVVVAPDKVGRVAADPVPGGRFRADGAYLITGGLGALGLSLAEYLAEHGAGALLLLGRSKPAPAVEDRLAAIRRTGTAVHVVQADVGSAHGVESALAGVRTKVPPLRGVFHAAGLLADATVQNVTAEQVTRVLAPKVVGARVLEEVTEADPLDLFVLFSSAAALVGNAGQAIYAAANSTLDALAHRRRQRGLPGLSVQWGPFSDVGLAADDDRRGARLEERGMGGFTAAEAWDALVRMIGRDAPVSGYVPIDTRRWFDAYPDTAALGSWQWLRTEADHGGQASASAFLSRLQATPEAERAVLAETKVRELAGRVLRLGPEGIDGETPFKALGLDSLMSLELRNRLEAAFGMKLSPTLLWAHGNSRALSKALCAQLPTPADVD